MMMMMMTIIIIIIIIIWVKMSYYSLSFKGTYFDPA